MKRSLFPFLILGLCCFAPAQTITITSPNGGENWAMGETHLITWTFSGIADGTPVKLVLFKDGVKVSNIIPPISIGSNGSGSYSWKVGNYEGGTAAAGAGYKIRIRDRDGKYPYDESDQPFTITAGMQAITRPNIVKEPLHQIGSPKLAVTGVDLVPYPDGTVNVIFGYKNAGTGPLPRRSAMTPQPDYRVVVDGRDLEKGDLFIPENPPAPPGWEVKTHSGGSLKFPSMGWHYQWFIGNMITVHVNEGKAGGMEADSRTFNLKNMALNFGYDLLINGMEFDWATSTLKIFIRLDGKVSPEKSFQLIIDAFFNNGPPLQFHPSFKANQQTYVFTQKLTVYAEIHRLTFNVYALFTPEGSEPILDVDQRNNILNMSFDRPR